LRGQIWGTKTARSPLPPPWSIEEHPESFAIVDATGQALAFLYFEDEGRPAGRDEAAHADRRQQPMDPSIHRRVINEVITLRTEHR